MKEISTFRCILGFALISAASLAGAPEEARAQSWDCKAPKNCTERVICETPQLGTLDERMSDLYFRLRDQSSRKGAQRLLDNQRQWLGARDSCGCNANCLVGMYTERIRQFEEVLY